MTSSSPSWGRNVSSFCTTDARELMMAERRPERVAHLVQAELARWLLQDAKDPRLRQITITAVQMTPDLRLARVYVRALGSSDAAGIVRVLTRASHAVRGAIGHALGLRVTPELRFEYDATPDQAERVEALLRSANTSAHDDEDDA